MTSAPLASATSTVSASSRTVALIVALAAGLVGCAPTCTQVCHKLDRCDLNGDVLVTECVASCEAEISDYRDTDDKDSKVTFNVQRKCLGSHSCDEIAAGACYESSLFPFSME